MVSWDEVYSVSPSQGPCVSVPVHVHGQDILFTGPLLDCTQNYCTETCTYYFLHVNNII